ncbi:hypothetical protein R84B8_02948 [Treponema sp. R8-4-B8]
MKKIAGKIAMILVIIIIANTFSGCLLTKYFSNADAFPIMYLFTIPLDLITSPIQIIVLVTVWAIEEAREERGKKIDGIDTFSAVNSLPEFDSLTRRISSLPEEKIVPFTETMNSFSKEENSAMLKAFNNLSEEEIASSIKALNLMPNEKLISTLNGFQNIRRGQ